MKIQICAPSYKRPQVKTLEYLPSTRVYVSPGEYPAYKKANPKADIVKCRNGVQGNLCRVRNYILRKEFKAGSDVVLLIDDDLEGVYFWEQCESVKVETRQFEAFINKYTVIARGLGVFFWAIQVNPDKQNYREYTPFSLTCYIGGPFQCFLKGNNCFYDEALFLKEDYDMTLQQLNINRKVLRVNKYFYRAKQSEQAGGCATQRNMAKEKEQFELLQKKWGARIVRRDENDRCHRRKKEKRHQDYNPIIKVPIRGI